MGLLRNQFCCTLGGARAIHVGQVCSLAHDFCENATTCSIENASFCRAFKTLSNLECLVASGITSAVGEQCLTNAGTLGVLPEPCLEAIAAGDGREIMKFDADIARMHMYRA